jgi:hypothetical protein
VVCLAAVLPSQTNCDQVKKPFQNTQTSASLEEHENVPGFCVYFGSDRQVEGHAFVYWTGYRFEHATRGLSEMSESL